jgi:hypothetical protein
VAELRVERFTGFAGLALTIAFALAALTAPPAGLLGAPETAGGTPAYLVEHRGATLVSAYLGGLAWGVLLVAFVVGLAEVLGRVEGEPRLLATVGLAGGVALAAVLCVVVLILTVLVQPRTLEAGVAGVVHDALFLANNISGFPTAVCVGAFSAIVLRDGGLPRWIGWIGVAVVVVHLVSAAALAASGPFSPTGVFGTAAPALMTIWVGCISVHLLRAG